MQLGNATREIPFNFLGDTFVDVEGNSQPSPWRKNVAGSTPGVVERNGGSMKVELTSFSGAQSAILHHNDVLSFDIDDLLYFEILWQLTMTGTNPDIAFGLASTGKAETAFSGLENALLFRVNADSLKLKAVSRLGTDTAVSETSNQVVGGGEWITSRIDFTTGVQAISQVATAPKAGKGAVKFYSGNPSEGRATERLVSREFDLSGYSGSLQPVVLAAKTTSADTAVLNIKEIRIGYNVA